jgi:hypothetical protein
MRFVMMLLLFNLVAQLLTGYFKQADPHEHDEHTHISDIHTNINELERDSGHHHKYFNEPDLDSDLSASGENIDLESSEIRTKPTAPQKKMSKIDEVKILYCIS